MQSLFLSVQMIPAEEYNKLVGKFVSRLQYNDYIWSADKFQPGEMRLLAASAVLTSDVGACKMTLA